MVNLEAICEENEYLGNIRGEVHSLQAEVQSKYTLSKEDFDRDFKGDDFKQGIGNCWMVSVLDSFVNYGDYENLVRTHVKKNDKGGYDITLPMGSNSYVDTLLKRKKVYRITAEDLLPQISIGGQDIRLLDKGAKKGIHCLIIALGQKLAKREDSNFDYNVLNGGISVEAMDALLSNFYSFRLSREKNNWINDQFFNIKLRSYLQNFNKKTDMMTVSVKWNGSWGNMGDATKENTNHAISVDSVFYKQNNMWVRLSNPQDASQVYDMPYNQFEKKCGRISFGSKEYKKVENDYGNNGFFVKDREYSQYSGQNLDSFDSYIKNKWGMLGEDYGYKRNLVVSTGYQLKDGRIVSSKVDGGGEPIFIVKSYNKRIIVKLDANGESCIFSCGGTEIKINRTLLDDNGLISIIEFANSINFLKKMGAKGFILKGGELFLKDSFIKFPIKFEWFGFKKENILSNPEKMKIVECLNKIV